MQSVGKSGKVESYCVGDWMTDCLLYDRLLKLIITYYLGLDNLNTCKENEMNV